MNTSNNNSNNSNNSTIIEEQEEDAPFFTLNGLETNGKVVKVYDGDTVHLLMRVLGTLYRWKCRIMHVDTPELRSKNVIEKEHAMRARDALSELILNKTVRVKCFQFDMYGRVLVELALPSNDTKDDADNNTMIVIHEWLLEKGHARRYEGKKREKWVFNDESTSTVSISSS